MKELTSYALLVCYLATNSPTIAQAQSKTAQETVQSAIISHSLHNYREAEERYTEALQQAEREGKTDQAVQALKGLGMLKMNQGNDEQSASNYKKAVELESSIPNLDPVKAADTIISLATAYRNLNRDSEAEPLYIKALSLAEKSENKEYQSIALDHLATMYRYEGKLANADEMSKRAVTLAQAHFGMKSANTAQAMANRGMILGIQAKYKEAESILKQAYSMSQSATSADSAIPTSIGADLALIYLTQGKLNEAKALYEKCISVRTKVLGNNDPTAAEMKANLARTYLEEGNLQKARQLGEESLASSELKYGKDGSFLGLVILGSIYNAQGDTAKAKGLAERAVKLGRSYKALLLMAQVLRKQGDITNAQKFANEAAQKCEKKFGPMHPQLALCLLELSATLKSTNSNQSAQLAKRAADIKAYVIKQNQPKK